jgi:hypothetical protein
LLGVPLAVSGIVAAVIALGALEWDRVRGYLLAFNDAMTRFINWLATIADKIKGLFGGSGGGATGQHLKDLEDANKNYVPMRFDPGTSKTKVTPISLALNIDGRVLAQSISEQLEQLYEHATGAPSANGMGHFGRADSQIMGT